MNYPELHDRIHSDPQRKFALYAADFQNSKAPDFLGYLAKQGSGELLLNQLILKNWHIWEGISYSDYLSALEDLSGNRNAVSAIAIIYYKYFGIDSVRIVVESGVFEQADKDIVLWFFTEKKGMFVQNHLLEHISQDKIMNVQDRLVLEGAPKAEYIDPNKHYKAIKWRP